MNPTEALKRIENICMDTPMFPSEKDMYILDEALTKIIQIIKEVKRNGTDS